MLFDVFLGLLFYFVLVIGFVCLVFMIWVWVDLLGLLFGDILLVICLDIVMIYGGGVVVLVGFVLFWC